MRPDRAQRLLALIRDLLDELESELQRIALDAQTDPLTGLYNRRCFDTRLTQEVERCRRYGGQVALVLIDLDDFKEYNDRHGHRHGDQLLATLGRCLAGAVREPDVVCRYGGEEFALILPETGEDGAVRLALRLRDRVHEEVRGVTFSAGIAVFPGDAATAHDLVDTADRALYHAKGVGKAAIATARGQVVRLLAGTPSLPRRPMPGPAPGARPEPVVPPGPPGEGGTQLVRELAAMLEALGGGMAASGTATEMVAPPTGEDRPSGSAGERPATNAADDAPVSGNDPPPAAHAGALPEAVAVGVGFAPGDPLPRCLWLQRQLIPVHRAEPLPNEEGFRVHTPRGVFLLRPDAGGWLLRADASAGDAPA